MVLVALVPLFVILLALAAWFLLGEDGAVPGDPITPEDTNPEQRIVIQATQEGVSRGLGEAAIAGTTEIDGKRTSLIPHSYEFSGFVIEEETFDPVQCFTMNLTQTGMSVTDNAEALFLERSFDNEKGAFSITIERAGQFSVWIKAPGYIMKMPLGVNIATEKGLTDFVIKLKRGEVLAGRVIEDDTGMPIEDAEVKAQGVANYNRDKEGNLRRSLGGMYRTVRTDKIGRFRIIGLAKGDYLLTATHRDHAYQSVDVASGDEQIEIHLKRGYRIYGTAYDDAGNPAPGIEIRYQLNQLNKRLRFGPYISGPDGKYRTSPVLPGRILVSAKAPGGSPTIVFTEEKKLVEISDRDVELDFGPHAGRVTWRGTFFAWEGKPGAYCRLEARLDLDQSELSILRTTTCDKEGRFEFRKLLPGTFKVAVYLAGPYRLSGSSEIMEITFERPGVYDIDLSLHNTEINGVLIDAETGKRSIKEVFYIEARSLDNARQYTFNPGADMRFYFRGLPPGSYRLSAYGLDFPPSTLEVNLAEGQIINNLRIAVPVSGELSVQILNLQEEREMFFRVYVRKIDGTASWEIGPGKKRDDGSWVLQFHLEIGSWRLVMEENELGRAVREFEVFEGETTKVILDASEFE
jgi:hypothetical protein